MISDELLTQKYSSNTQKIITQNYDILLEVENITTKLIDSIDQVL